MPNNKNDPIVGVSDDDLSSVISTFSSVPLTEAEDVDRFMREVRRLAELRAQSEWPNENGGNVAVFVLADRPRQFEAKFREILDSTEKVLDLRANTVPLFGKLFILNKDGSNGFSSRLPGDENAILEWLEDIGLGASPIAILWRQTRQLAVRRHGASDTAQYEDIRDVAPAATLQQLLSAITNFHKRQLLTPGDCKGIWEQGRAAQYVPGPQPEKAIQYALRIALDSWFHGVVKAESEDTTPVGRIDIRLLTSSITSQRLGYWAIIELKVFRSLHNAPKRKKPKSVPHKDNVNTMEDGLMQIQSYKQDRKADEGLLEVFDLRNDKSKDIFIENKIKTLLTKCDPSIQVNIRPLFGSDKDYRKSQFS